MKKIIVSIFLLLTINDLYGQLQTSILTRGYILRTIDSKKNIVYDPISTPVVSGSLNIRETYSFDKKPDKVFVEAGLSQSPASYFAYLFLALFDAEDSSMLLPYGNFGVGYKRQLKNASYLEFYVQNDIVPKDFYVFKNRAWQFYNVSYEQYVSKRIKFSFGATILPLKEDRQNLKTNPFSIAKNQKIYGLGFQGGLNWNFK
jgi:hypothetical protein